MDPRKQDELIEERKNPQRNRLVGPILLLIVLGSSMLMAWPYLEGILIRVNWPALPGLSLPGTQVQSMSVRSDATRTPLPTLAAVTPSPETKPTLSAEPTLPAPSFASLLAFGDEQGTDDWARIALQHARISALPTPYRWELYALKPGTDYASLRAYYLQLLNKERKYRLIFEEHSGEEYIIKFTNEIELVVIQFWGVSGAGAPGLAIFYLSR